MNTIIRNAAPEDAEELLEIYRYYVEHTAITFEVDAPTVAEFRGRIVRTMEKYPYLVLEQEGTILGYAYAGPLKGRAAYDWACEMTIYLRHGMFGNGFGRQIYTALEEALRGMGILNLYACIASPDAEDEVLTHASQRFHAHMGYRLCGRFEKCGCKFGRWFNMVWMEKLIGEHAANQAPVTPYPALASRQPI